MLQPERQALPPGLYTRHKRPHKARRHTCSAPKCVAASGCITPASPVHALCATWQQQLATSPATHQHPKAGCHSRSLAPAHSNCTLRDPQMLQKSAASEAVLQILFHWAANASPSPQGWVHHSTDALQHVDAQNPCAQGTRPHTNEMRKQCPHPHADVDNTWQRSPPQ